MPETGKLGSGRTIYLVASHLLGNIAQGLQNVQAELLTLLIFEYGNILNMTHTAEAANAAFVVNEADGEYRRLQGENQQFPLFEQSSGADDLATAITHHQEEVRIRDLGQPVILALPCLLRDIADLSQDAERVQVVGRVVGALQWPNGVVGRQTGAHVR